MTERAPYYCPECHTPIYNPEAVEHHTCPTRPHIVKTKTSTVKIDTSREAANWLDKSGRKVSVMQMFYDMVKFRGCYGSTCDEAEVELRVSHQTMSSGIRALEKQQLVKKTDTTRNTRYGHPAKVYVTSTPRPNKQYSFEYHR